VAQTGAVAAILDPNASLAAQIEALLTKPSDGADVRDRLGKERRGRPKAADIAERVYGLAHGSR
jgi:malonate decarboxylase gamma subunit